MKILEISVLKKNLNGWMMASTRPPYTFYIFPIKLFLNNVLLCFNIQTNVGVVELWVWK